MKKLVILFLLLPAGQIAIAQHYGGLSFAPVFLKNNGQNFNWSNSAFTPDRSGTTFGYSIGFQGLLFPNKRFSISYGLNYVRTHIDDYNDFYYLNSSEQNNYQVGLRTTFEDIEVPVALRLNLIKKAKFQPYISLAPVLVFPLGTSQDFIHKNGELHRAPVHYDRNWGLQMEAGAGINYFITENIVINLRLSYRRESSNLHRFQTAISFIFKF